MEVSPTRTLTLLHPAFFFKRIFDEISLPLFLEMKHRSLRFELDSIISFERVVLSVARKPSDRVLCRGRPLAPCSC